LIPGGAGTYRPAMRPQRWGVGSLPGRGAPFANAWQNAHGGGSASTRSRGSAKRRVGGPLPMLGKKGPVLPNIGKMPFGRGGRLGGGWRRRAFLLRRKESVVSSPPFPVPR
jgi:hypothetical protein